MIDTLIAFCADRWPEITAMVAFVIVAFFAAWKFSKYHSSIEETKKKVNSLPCETHKTQLDKIESLKSIVSSTNEIVIEISKWIAGKDKKMIDTLMQKRSPYTITNIGHQVLEKSGGKKVIDNNLDFFINELEILNLKTPYDIEDKSTSIIFGNLSNEMFNDIKNFIYYSPEKIEMTDPDTSEKRNIEITLSAILNVMGVYLRDKYFEKHPEINMGDFFDDKNKG